MIGKAKYRQHLVKNKMKERVPFSNLHTAEKIGQRLVQSAVWHNGRCTWTGDDVKLVNDEWQVFHQTVDPFLYSGTAGIALFLLLCHEQTGGQGMRRTAIGAIRQSLYLVEAHHDAEVLLGLHDGLTGIALVALAAGNRLKEPVLITAGQALVDKVCTFLKTGREEIAVDFISGAAGIITGLLQIAGITNDRSLYRVCEKVADQLLGKAHQTRYGIYWPEEGLPRDDIGLCGMAHGNSGIAYAFMELATATGNTLYMKTAAQSLVYERSWFHPGESNWPDNRGPDETRTPVVDQELVYPLYWCHGAPGIGLARLRAYQLTGDPLFLAEATAALHASSRHAKRILAEARKKRRPAPEVNMSVCHGLGSIIELFVYASTVLGNEDFYRRASSIGAFSAQVSVWENGKWRCGIQDGGEAPGLMLGLAGIGCAYLQLHNPVGMQPLGLMNLAADYC